MKDKYYVMINGIQEGPYTMNEIVKKGIDSESYVFNKELGDWTKIKDLPNLNLSTSINTPPSQNKSESETNNFQRTHESKGFYEEKQKMFSNPFSFEGRIRRTEYGLSSIIQYILTQVVFVISVESPILLFLLIPILWFALAQGSKRCHDLGNSGWYQIIPFYGLWLIFQEGESNSNEYGLNPKR